MQFAGCLEAYVDRALVGWALAVDLPGQRLLLQVEIAGELAAVGLANRDRRDVGAAGHGDGLCGFHIPVSLPPGIPFCIREATTRTILFTQENLASITVSADAPVTAPSLLQGHVDSAGGTSIRGWCWAPADPSRHIAITATADGVAVAHTRADERRGDLDSAGIGGGDHAFTLEMPFWMLDGMERLVTVTAQGVEIDGSPIRFTGLAQGPRPLLNRLFSLVPDDDTGGQWAAATLDTYLRHLETLAPLSVGFVQYEAWLQAQLTGHRWAKANPTAISDHPDGTLLRLLDAQGNIHIALIDDGATPLPHGLPALIDALNRTEADIVYADAQVVTDNGVTPWFRPDWSYDLCLAQDYTRGVTLLREQALAGLETNGTIAGLRMAALLACDPARIHHEPEIACSLTSPPSPQAVAAANAVVARHVARRTGGRGQVVSLDTVHGLRRVNWPMPDNPPLVSLLIPTRDRLELLRTAVDSIIQRTRYFRFEIIIIDNQSRDPATLDWLDTGQRQGRFEVLRYDGPFNFADMNNQAAARSSGDIIGFINNDVELISPDWLETAIGLLSRPDVGAVGGRLRFANGMLQHGGVIVGTSGLAENAFQHVHADDTGYFHRTRVAGNYSAVTAACLFCHREEFLEMGGFDAVNLPVAFNDVDLCLRLREEGRQVVWTPHIDLYHYESASRGRDNTPEKQARAMKEALYMRQRWARQAAADPFYNANLNLDGMPFTGLAIPPRHRWGGVE